MNYKKEEIFIDLRKLSEEEIKSIPNILKDEGELIYTETEMGLSNGNLNGYEAIYLTCSEKDRYWVRGLASTPKAKRRTEITFQQFKELFRDLEGEMLDMLKDIERSLRNGFNITSSKEQEIRKLISEVELKRQGNH